MKKSNALSALSVLLLLFLAQNCARDYVTGKRTFNLVSESQEIAIGRESDPAVISEYGLYDDPKLAAYVNSIGQSIARVSHRPNLTYTFRIVDSPIVNAFALPGGWIYFTRGILAHFNTEDELVGVMGHEIGHVVARHGAEQLSKAQLASIGLGIGSLVSKKFNQVSRLAETGLGLIFLSYGRAQESESDKLGVEYATRLGYDAHRMANFFSTIGALSAQNGTRIPPFLSTHPDPGDRRARVNQLATELQKQPSFQPKKTSRAAYLRRIEGVVYGDDPRQGFVENGVFYHPQLRFQFPVPARWQVQNSPSVVMLTEPDNKAAIQFRIAAKNTVEAALADFLQANGVNERRRARRNVHGMAAVELESTLGSNNGKLQILSYFISKGGKVYIFHGISAPADFSTFRRRFVRVGSGFDQLRNRAALNRQPERIRIVSAPQTGTLAQVLQRLHVKQDRVVEFALLNGKQKETRVRRGELLKIVK